MAPRPVSAPTAFLRWAGSKKKLLPHLKSYWSDENSRYVEPFAGSSRLFFQLLPSVALLSDKNSELIHAYAVLKDDPVALYDAIVRLPSDEASFYRIRELRPETLGDLKRAARFVYLNRYCFNGIYRTNRDGRFNVPYAKNLRKAGDLPSLHVFLACSRALLNATIAACDFGATLRKARHGDFVYMDPPYAVSGRRVFLEYGPSNFAYTDLSRLARHLPKLHNRGVTFLLSYADCREARELFHQWSLRRIKVRRHIAGFAGSRRSAFELLITNIRR